jgi:periplasmic divalent cation tolerance protein
MRMAEDAVFIEVRWTSGSIDEARRVSRHLVKEKWVAQAQIVPWVESIYLLDGKLETAQQSKINMLTRQEHYEKVKKYIEENCSYEVPEVTYVVIAGGSMDYLSMAIN